ncbi:MAG: PLP-dependent aminotransferase family protein [bacterium]|nr:PLP-dependent aminotransferase family protein [bacterium]
MTIWLPNLDSSKPQYQAIADALAHDIATGKLLLGNRLPTQRELADVLEVSVGTVTRAYAAAERRGLIRGETGRGTFVGRTAPQSFGVAGFPAAPDVIDLGVSWPLHAQDPDLSRALRELRRRPDLPELLQYQPNAGMRRHREAGAVWMRQFGLEPDADDVLVCAGTQHAMTMVFSSVMDTGDVVLTEELTYPGVRVVADLLGLRVIGLAMDEDGILPESFETACRQPRAKLLYTVPTLQNPTTATLPESRRRTLADIARKYDVAIFEDAVHQLLADDPPVPIATFAPEQTYFIAAPSKAVVGGLRVGFLMPPKHRIEAMERAIWATTWMVSPLTAEIAAMWIEDGTFDETVERKREEARRRIELMRRVLSGTGVHSQGCSYHAWIDLPECWGSAQFVNEARHKGVAVTPSDTFSVGNGAAPNGFRISLCAAPNMDVLERGLNKIAEVLARPPGMGGPIV